MRGLTLRRNSDLLVAALVFVLAGLGAWGYLRNDAIKVRPDATPDDYSLLPSLLWATGHGFSFTIDPLPDCDAFLLQQQEAIEPDAVPSDLHCFPAIARSVQDRQNLLYLVGIIWRVFGISWSNLKIALAVIFAINAVLTYALFRLGMNRLLSIVGVLLAMTAPVLLRETPWLRSVCKAPFILVSILIIGHILTTRMRPRTILFLALLTGCVIGVGFGFRQDPLICLPAAAGAIALGARIESKHWFAYRMLACVLLAAAFTVTGWPSLRITRDTGGSNAFYLIQGFSASCLAEADLRPPFYAVATDTDDYLIHGIISEYADKLPDADTENYRSVAVMRQAHFVAMLQSAPTRAVCDVLAPMLPGDLELCAPTAEFVGRSLVRDLHTTFPGDFVTRWYGTVLRVIRGMRCPASMQEDVPIARALRAIHQPISAHLEHYGHWYALATVLAVASQSVWLALCLLGILLYFGGYVSLEFQTRHAFHLNFLAYWFPLFLLGGAWRVARGACRFRMMGLLNGIRNLRGWLPYIGRPAVLSLCMLLILVSLLYGARWFQMREMRDLRDRFAHADLEPLPYHTMEKDGRTLYVPDAFPAFQESVLDRLHEFLAGRGFPAIAQPIVRSEYVVLETETTGGGGDFSYQGNMQDIFFRLRNADGPTRVLIFTPVFKYADSYMTRETSSAYFTFKGFRLGSDITLKNIYRVRNTADFPLLLTAFITDNPENTEWYCRLPRLSPWGGAVSESLTNWMRDKT